MRQKLIKLFIVLGLSPTAAAMLFYFIVPLTGAAISRSLVQEVLRFK